MSFYLYVILAYLLVMTGYNIYRSRQVKSQDDFMVAGRSLSLTKMVFTLVCTWIGSGTFIAGADADARKRRVVEAHPAELLLPPSREP